MSVMEMSVLDWIALDDNPRQRNTVKRANIAVRKHLSAYHPVHKNVSAAVKNGAVICKLDGHTRAYLWAEGLLGFPPDGKVDVALVPVSSKAEAKDVYDMLDSPVALKKPCDMIYGAARENGFTMGSHLLRSCSHANQIRLAGSGRFKGHLYELVKEWKPHMMALDGLNLTTNYTTIIAAMLVAIRHDGVEKAGPFFCILDANEGTKDTKTMDGPEALHKHMEVRRAEHTTAGYDNVWSLQCYAWSAYTKWANGKRMKVLRAAEPALREVIATWHQKKKQTASRNT